MTEVVFIALVALRLLIPLGIPKYPLPLILAALVIDGVDQTIFQAVDATSVLDNYQSYDKALDIYYLTIAYAAVMRNWLDPFALGIAQFLFYSRLAGTLAFELSGSHSLLIVFANTFEYFFIFYETIRLFWNPSRMKPQLLLGTALSIWALVKLPQEYWLHFAGLDFTDEQALHPWLLPSLALASVLVLIAAWRLRSHLPPRDRDPTFDVDAYIDRPPSAAVFPRREVSSIFSAALAEKVLLLAAVAVIFSQILDEIRASALQVALGVGVIVVLNSAVSLWRVKHGSRYGSTAIQFLAMATVNGGILAAGVLLRQTAGLPAYMPAQDAIFYLLLISLIITMYDRYRVIRDLSQDRRPRLRR